MADNGNNPEPLSCNIGKELSILILRLTELEAVTTRSSNDVCAIKTALLGDEYRTEGLISKVNEHEKKLKKAEKIGYIAIGIGAIFLFLIKWGNAVWTAIINITNKLS